MNQAIILAQQKRIDELEGQVEALSMIFGDIDQEAVRYGLTAVETRIFLVLEPGRLMSKEQLLNALCWDRPSEKDWPDIGLVGVLLCKIRAKLCLKRASWWIRTVWNQGYIREAADPGIWVRYQAGELGSKPYLTEVLSET